jgi:hypothetical protein
VQHKQPLLLLADKTLNPKPVSGAARVFQLRGSTRVTARVWQTALPQPHSAPTATASPALSGAVFGWSHSDVILVVHSAAHSSLSPSRGSLAHPTAASSSSGSSAAHVIWVGRHSSLYQRTHAMGVLHDLVKRFTGHAAAASDVVVMEDGKESAALWKALVSVVLYCVVCVRVRVRVCVCVCVCVCVTSAHSSLSSYVGSGSTSLSAHRHTCAVRHSAHSRTTHRLPTAAVPLLECSAGFGLSLYLQSLFDSFLRRGFECD